MLVQPIIGYMSRSDVEPALNSAGLLPSNHPGVVCTGDGVTACGWRWAYFWLVRISNIGMGVSALVGDLLPTYSQRTTGFAAQTFSSGCDRGIVRCLVFTNWFDIAPIPRQRRDFHLSIEVLHWRRRVLLAVLWTVIRTKEYPPEDAGDLRWRSSAQRVFERHP
jgi:maltose/moltooligosaccharide transporter